MKSFLKTSLWLIGLLMVADCVSAQQIGNPGCTCNSKDYSPAGVMLGMRHLKGMWMFSYNYMNSQTKSNISGKSAVDDDEVFEKYLMSPQTMHMDMHMLMVMYGLSNRITLMAMLNYTRMDMHMNMFTGTSMHMHGGAMEMTNNSTVMEMQSSGLADSKLYALYSFYTHPNITLMATCGVNIPNGKTTLMGSEENMFVNQHLPYMMQLGSGSFDFMPGFTCLLNKNNFECSAQINSVVRPFYNNIGYKLGNEISANAWAAYQWFGSLSASLRVEGNASSKIQGSDPQLYSVMEPDADANNYGGKKINGYAGASFFFKKGFLVKNSRLLAEYGLPLYENVNGIQLKLNSAINASWRFAF